MLRPSKCMGLIVGLFVGLLLVPTGLAAGDDLDPQEALRAYEQTLHPLGHVEYEVLSRIWKEKDPPETRREWESRWICRRLRWAQ